MGIVPPPVHERPNSASSGYFHLTIVHHAIEVLPVRIETRRDDEHEDEQSSYYCSAGDRRASEQITTPKPYLSTFDCIET